MNKNAKKIKKSRVTDNRHRESAEPQGTPANRGWWLSLVDLPELSMVVMWLWFKNQQPREESSSRVDPILEVAELRSRLRHGDYQQVLSRCRELLKDNPTDSSLLVLSGEAATK